MVLGFRTAPSLSAGLSLMNQLNFSKCLGTCSSSALVRIPFLAVPLFVVAALAIMPMTTAQGGILTATAMGDITLSGPTSGSIGPAAVPAYPGFLALTVSTV